MDNLTAGNPVAHRVRVYYTGDDILKEGEPLCYSFKTTKNWWGGSVSDEGAVTASVFAAEGTQNSSKYMSVESPLRLSLSSDTPADGSKTITGSTTDFDTLHVGMFVSIAGTDVTNGNYEITAISRSTESGVTNSTITLGNMTAATGTTADVSTKIDNIPAFAGVVAKGGWVGRTGPRVVDIYVPNGAVVPVRNDQNCTLGRTILAVHTNEQYLTAPHASDAYPVAIAWETVDTATTTGLCLAKLDPNIFIHQMGDNGGLIVDDEDTTSSIAINKMEITFNGSATYHRALYYIANLDGGGAGLNGVFKFRAYVNSTMTSLVQVVCANLHIKDAGVIITGSGEWNSAFYGTVETETTTTQADLSGGKVAGIQLAYYVDETTGAPARAAVIAVPAGFGAGTYDWDCLIWTGKTHLGDSASGADEASHVIGFDGDGDTRKIPIYFGEDLYYFLVGTAIQGVADA
jgi:hypothetical protein